MMPAERYSYLSSRLVKEVFQLGGAVRELVPPVVERRLREKYGRPRARRGRRRSAAQARAMRPQDARLRPGPLPAGAGPRGLAHGGRGPEGGGPQGRRRRPCSTSAWASPTSPRRATSRPRPRPRSNEGARATRPRPACPSCGRRWPCATRRTSRSRSCRSEVAITTRRQAGALPGLPGPARPRRRGGDPVPALAHLLRRRSGWPGARPILVPTPGEGRLQGHGAHDLQGHRPAHQGGDPQQPLQPHRRRHRSRGPAGDRRHGRAPQVHAPLRRHLRAARLRPRRTPAPCRRCATRWASGCVVLGTASKSYCMTGWRIGWVLGPRALVDACAALVSHSTQCPTDLRAGGRGRGPHRLPEVRAGPGGRVPPPPRLHPPGSDRDPRASPACSRPAASTCSPTSRATWARGVPSRWTWPSRLLEEEKVAVVPGEGFAAPGYLRDLLRAADGATCRRARSASPPSWPRSCRARALARETRCGSRTTGWPRATPVVVYLQAPKEKVWGLLVSTMAAGVVVRGIDLAAFDDWMRQEARGEDALLGASTVFYPMTRVERMEKDETVGPHPSYCRALRARGGPHRGRGAGPRADGRRERGRLRDVGKELYGLKVLVVDDDPTRASCSSGC